jgi:hypothetical protein
MTTLSIVSMGTVSAARAGDHSPKPIALFCCIGLVASFFLVSLGVDLSAGSLI